MKPVAPVTKYLNALLLPGERQAYTPAPAPPRPSPPAKRAAPGHRVGEHRGAGLRLQREPVGRAAGRSPRSRRGGRRASSPGGSARGPRPSPARASRCSPAGTTSVTQAHGQRLVGVDEPAGEDQVQRAAHADDARQALRAAVDQRHAPAALGEAERRALGGDPQVAPQRELEAAGQAPAGDRGDRRLGRRQAGEAQRPVGVVEARRRRSRSP